MEDAKGLHPWNHILVHMYQMGLMKIYPYDKILKEAHIKITL